MRKRMASATETPAQFPSTEWSDVLAAGDLSHPQNRERLDRLVGAYWKPVFTYVRAAWRKTIEDAMDLTQAFFAEFLEKNYLARLRPERGSFRGYLKRALKHFLIDAERAASARRPPKPPLPIDATSIELDRLGPAFQDESPDDAYDREWVGTVLSKAVERLANQLRAEGKSRQFEVFRTYCLEPMNLNTRLSKVTLGDRRPPATPTYAGVARRLGIRESEVRQYLHESRKLLRYLVEQQIRSYVSSEAELRSELREIMPE